MAGMARMAERWLLIVGWLDVGGRMQGCKDGRMFGEEVTTMEPNARLSHGVLLAFLVVVLPSPFAHLTILLLAASCYSSCCCWLLVVFVIVIVVVVVSGVLVSLALTAH